MVLPESATDTVTIASETLALILDILQPAVNPRSAIPELRDVLLKDGMAVGCNSNMWITVETPRLAGGLHVTAPHLLLRDTVAALGPGPLALRSGEKERQVALQQGEFNASLLGHNPSDFPPVPAELTHRATADEAFLAALRRVAVYAATEDTRPVLHGVLLELGPESRLVAADGFRLGVIPVKVKAPDPCNLVMSLEAVQALGQVQELLHKNSYSIRSLHIDSNDIYARFQLIAEEDAAPLMTVSIYAPLRTGNYPKYTSIIPAPQADGVVFQAQELARLVAALTPLAQEGFAAIRLQWEADTLRASIKGEDTGNAAGTIPCQATGAGKVAFNPAYLLSVLEGCDEMRMECPTSTSPARFTAGKDLAVVMPMFVQW